MAEAQEARPGDHRLAEAGHARPRDRGGPRAGARGGPRSRHLHPRLRVHLPLGHAGGVGRDRHRRRPRRAPHPVDELVPPRRGALRGVRLVVPGHARVRGRPLALRHRLQHEHGPPHPGRRTVFEHLDDAGLRTACTTWLIYRGRTRHDPSGASVYRRIAEAAQFRHAVYGARELFYADLFDSRDTGCTLRARDARPARPPRRLRGRLSGRERPLRLPALLASRQRHLLAQGGPRRPGRARSPRRTGRSSGSCMPPAGWTRSWTSTR